MPQQLTFDICANRHQGHRNSEKANETVNEFKAPMRERIRIWVDGCGFQGTTLKDICAHFGKLPHQVSGRISELKQANKLFDSTRDRDGFSILVSRREWISGSAK